MAASFVADDEMNSDLLVNHPVRDFFSRRRDTPYISKAELAVLEYGRTFAPADRPTGFDLGKPKDCVVNAGNFTISSAKFGTYVEGFAASDEMPPFHHAWLTLDGKTAVDVTLQDSTGFYYFGIEFSTEFLLKWVCRRKIWGLLDPFDESLIEELRGHPKSARQEPV